VANRLERVLVAEGEEAPGTELAAAAKTLAQGVPHLVREEIALAKLEARASAKRAGIAAAAGGLGVLGLVFLLVGAAIVVAQATESIAAGPLVVGAALLVASAIVLALVMGSGRPEPKPSVEG
jgi:hypothetical protein